MVPDEMKELIEKRKWIKSLSKAVPEGILIVLLSDHKKTRTDSDDRDNNQLSLFPEVAAILLDKNG